MKNFTRLLFTGVLLLLFSGYGMAQQNSQFTTIVGKLIRTTPRLADIDKNSVYGAPFVRTRDEHGIIGLAEDEETGPAKPHYPSKFAKDMAVQNSLGTPTPTPSAASATINQNFDGLFATGFAPSDNNMAVGPNHVIQIINNSSSSLFKIWNKAGTQVQAQTVLSSITGITGGGDPVVLYDQIADRWILTEFTGNSPNSLIWAVSTTGDPTGSYKIYSYAVGTYFADYPHYGVWQNAYYGITHDFNTALTAYLGSSIMAFDRNAMLAGAATATMISTRFTPNEYFTMLPVHHSGTAVSNQTGLFMFFSDDTDTPDPNDVDSIITFTYTPNFTTPANSVIGFRQGVVATPFNSTLCGSNACITQPPGGGAIRGIDGQLMHKVTYRNYGGYESIVANFTTNAGSGIGGIRWYEMRRTGGAGNWTMYQEGTYAPGDGNHRFMGSIAQNANGDIGLIFNVTGPGTPNIFPSFRLTGRTNCDPLGQMTIPETVIQDGTVINGTNRYGDYNAIDVDPSNGTFWGTGQYNKTGLGTFGNWATRIVNFTISGGGAQITSQPVSTTVCAGTTAAFSVAANGGGTILYQWQVSTDNGVTWTNIGGATASTYSFTAVAGDNGKRFRCNVTSSACPQVATSNQAILTITTLSQGGTLSASTSVACAGPNSTVLTLTGAVGNIIQWESSVNGGATWTVIANTTNTLTVNNLTQTTQYRVLVQSAGCTASYSTIFTVNFIATGVGTVTITSDAGTTLCAGDPAMLTAVGLNSYTFSNPAPIVIPSSGPGSVYPSTITVSGVPVTTPIQSVKINGISHTWSDDIDILLQSPTGVNVVLMSDVGSSSGISNVTYTFNDAGAAMSTAAGNPTGTYKPTNNGAADTWVAPGPGAITQGTPSLSLFTGDPNGIWKLFVVDDTGGDQGNIAGGYEITFASTGPLTGMTFLWSPATGLNATNINPVAASPAATTTYTVVATNGSGCTGTASITLNVNQRPKVTADPANTSVCAASSATFSITATGTSIGYQWQESTNGGVTWTNLTNGAPYSGVNTNTLVVNPVTPAMNNNRYRCVVSGICTPAANSTGAILTVKALPNVTVTPISGCGGVAGTNGLALTASGGDTYVWAPVTGLYTNPGTTTAYTGTNLATVYAAPTAFTAYVVTGTNNTTGCSKAATALVNYTPPAPTVTPNPVAMCLGDAAVKLKSSSSTTTTVSFASGNIHIPILDANPAGTAPTSLNVTGIPAGATISRVTVTLNVTHTYIADMTFNLKAPNGQVLNLDKNMGATGNPGANFTNTIISSAGTAPLSGGAQPYSATFKADLINGGITPGYTYGDPTGYAATAPNWAALYSVPNGTWTLAGADDGAGDVGFIENWTLNITYVVGVPAAPAVWSPATGLYSDANAGTPYVAGTAVDSVWAKPTPAGVYNYNVTVNSLPPAPTTVTMNNTATTFFATLTFNVRNNNNYPVTLTDISSMCNVTGATNVSAYYKASAINGLPGPITAANGWNQFGSATITSIGFPNVQPFMTGLNLLIPANSTYGILVSAILPSGTTNLVFSNTGTNLIASAGGCDILTGPNIGYAGPAVPGAPTFTPYHFIGSIGIVPGVTACTSPARVVTVTVNQPISITTQPVNTSACTDKVATFTVAAAGTSPSYQWQVSTDAGNTFTNISNGGVYAGATTTTLTITAPPVSMSGYLYRCVVSGAAPCASVPSAQRVLTVNPLPTITIGASPYQRLFPGLKTSIFSTVTPAAATYTWLRNGATVPNGSTSSLVVDVDGLGTYSLRVTDVNGCTNTSNSVTIADSASGKVFIYPNPNNGQFQVRYYSILNNSGLPRGINVYDARGKRVLTNTYSIGAPYARMDVDLRNHGTGVYWIEVVDVNGNRLAVGRAEVLR